MIDARPWAAAGAALLATAVVLPLLARAAARLALVDDGSDAPQRKSQRAAVPLVGGLAIAAGLAAAAWITGSWPGAPGAAVPTWLAGARGFDPRLVTLALAVGLGVGLVDDLRARGLGPGAKLGGQIAAGIALACAGPLRDAEPSLAASALCVVGAVVAMNLVNTFDHHDGTASVVVALGLAAAGAPGAGAVLGFLPWNLAPRQARAYLGDAGAHLLGLLVLVTPWAWGAFALPACDLARVLAERARAGHPPWSGDRRHFGHVLAARGQGRGAVVLGALAAAAPAVIGIAWSGREPALAAWGALSVLVSLVAGAALGARANAAP